MKITSIRTCTILFCAAAVCILQGTVAKPLLVPEEESHIEKVPLKFGLLSEVSGLYVRMTESGTTYSVDAGGNAEIEENAKWNLYMLGDGILRFENALYEGKYLVMSVLGNQTIVSGHDINLPLTRSDVEMLLGQEEPGSGAMLAADEDNSEENDFFASADWQNRSWLSHEQRFVVTTESGKECYLAFNQSGEQVKNICGEPDSLRVIFQLFAIFN